MQAMREYETLYILRPELSDENVVQVNERIKGLVERDGGRFLKCDVWGKKRLAFEVAKNPKGIMVQLCYLSGPDAIREIERNLRMMEPVVRYQTVKIADRVDVEARLAEQAAEDRARAEQAAARAAAEAARAEAEAEANEREAAGSDDREDDRLSMDDEGDEPEDEDSSSYMEED
ncbi:MAG: 30S ribosomal protein S6 [Deltaproteobacteria bacterium]|nr:30S ribosomal protein S6 [Deltaproteobacteria bacterium]